jgi:pimeloyl-ACP methyl ester carboxylesterase
MRRLIAVVATVGLGAAGLATASQATASPNLVRSPASAVAAVAAGGAVPVTASTIKWGSCKGTDAEGEGAVCALLKVPLNYAKPHGKKIKIAVSMIKHTVPAAQYQGAMLVNPGGPGDSGLDLVDLGSYVPNGAADAYDWIGFAPRGTEGSTPALTCEPNYFKGPRMPFTPKNKAATKKWLKLSKSYAKACGKHGGDLLNHLTTKASARDMDSIRKALGQKQINYYGFSYGTYLGQVYSTMYPTHVRRMILDSNVDPRTVWYKANLQQDTAFEKNMNIWFAWVAKYNSVYHLGTTGNAVRKLFFATQAKLNKHPSGPVGGDEWNDIFLSAGYYQSTWLELGGVFSGYINDHDTATLRSEYEDAETPGDDNGFAMYNATQCTDAAWPGVTKTLRDNRRLAKTAPYLTWNNAWYNAPCLYWPAKAHKPVKVNGKHVASVLLIDETLDAATPYEGSLETRKLFPHSSLIALPGGTSHANSLDGDACLDNQIAAYLADGTLPPRKAGNQADTTCAPLPVPDPTEEGSVQAQARGAQTAPLGLLPNRPVVGARVR